MRADAALLGMVGAVAMAIGLGADASAASVTVGPRAAGDLGASIEQSTCGKPGDPPCPMQKWMRANVAGPLADNDTAALAAGLGKAAALVPEAAWSSWVTMASSGAEAAKKGDVVGARAACKGCHDAWRDAYRAKYRLRPIPR